MKPLAYRALVPFFIVAFSAMTPAVAQTPKPPAAADQPAAGLSPIEVAKVRFSFPNAGSKGKWCLTEVELQPRGGVGADNRMFLNRVKVTLSLGVNSVKLPAGAKVPDTYYRASAEAVAVETTGGRSIFRFYLPPEIVKRDQITGDIKYYLVELTADGKPLKLEKENVSFLTLGTPQLVDSFKAKVASDSGINEGVLLPQYLTQFDNNTSLPAPSFIRLETAR